MLVSATSLLSVLILVCTKPVQSQLKKSSSTERYIKTRDSIITCRDSMGREYLGATNEESRNSVLIKAGPAFIQAMIYGIVPHWYGTPWNFYGKTENPPDSSIACGYFVTTTLRHAGVMLDRVALAECASQTMIEKLTDQEFMRIYRSASIYKFLEGVKQTGDGLYIVGLDFHTGFILCEKSKIYFIHSAYIPPDCVTREDASSSPILVHSQYRVTGKISDDMNFIRKWVQSEKF